MGKWQEPKDIALALCGDLGLAMCDRKDNISNVLFESLRRWGPPGEFLDTYTARWLYEECIRYGNVRFFRVALHYSRNREWPKDGEVVELDQMVAEQILRTGSKAFLNQLIGKHESNVHGVWLDNAELLLALQARHHDLAMVLPDEGAAVSRKSLHQDGTKEAAFVHIFRTSSQDFIRQVFEKSEFSVNNIGLNYTPLWLALEAGRHDLATWLLLNGADVDGHSIREGRAMTTARRAFLLGREADVELLLKWEAEK